MIVSVCAKPSIIDVTSLDEVQFVRFLVIVYVVGVSGSSSSVIPHIVLNSFISASVNGFVKAIFFRKAHKLLDCAVVASLPVPVPFSFKSAISSES